MKENSKILIVDDALDNIVFLKTLLKGDERVFIVAENGKDGVELAQNELPDLILLDAMMPIMDGFEATTKLKSNAITERIPILMITALSEKDEKIRALECGVTDFVTKPFDKTELIARCKSLINMSKLNQKYILASSNPATNLPNKVALLDDIIKMRNPKLFLIYIENFQELTDFYGAIYSEVIEQFFVKVVSSFFDANKLKKWSIYHVDGGKFAIVTQEDIGIGEGKEFCEKLNNSFKNPNFQHDGYRYSLNIAIGFAFGNIRILERASLALGEAMKEEKDYFYDEDILQKVNKEIENNLYWAKELQKAIKDDRIVPYFQPIYNLKTNKIEKFEALVRLIKTDGEVVSPFFFLDVAKKARLYNDITKIILTKTLEIAKNNEYEFSVNLSFLDIDDENIRNFIQNKMSENMGIANRIVFEIVESEGISNYKKVSDFIYHIKSFGVKIAIDDFGSGYSNFSRILEFDADFIKIDGSLIKNINSNTNSEDIVRMIVNFSKKKGFKTIGEFVHSEPVLNLVKTIDIDFVQGYFIGEPKKELQREWTR